MLDGGVCGELLSEQGTVVYAMRWFIKHRDWRYRIVVGVTGEGKCCARFTFRFGSLPTFLCWFHQRVEFGPSFRVESRRRQFTGIASGSITSLPNCRILS